MKVVFPTMDTLHEAGEALRRGELVGMPTETVYGIAAIATNPTAVLNTFALKKRPADNPLIVHLASAQDALTVVAEWPDTADALANAFWPGPMTLVLPKRPHVPSETTGGLDTVAIRVPSHPVARALIRSAGSPLSAPSANSFMHLSPTRAEHIEDSILDGLALVLDGGPCEVGLESTVIDCTDGTVRVLRPGHITRAQIEAVLGFEVVEGHSTVRKSPGMYPRHYAPSTTTRLVKSLAPTDVGLTFESPANESQIQMPADPNGYASALYAALHQMDTLTPAEILIVEPPISPEWQAVWDRLRKMLG